MKVFDFDNTIYHGESSVDFSLFMIRKNRRIILYLPVIFFNLIKYKLCLVDKKRLEATINNFLKVMIKDKEETFNTIAEFWEENVCKLNRRMLALIKKNDVIITASPRFLIEGIQERLNTRNLICTEVDPDKRELICFNFGETKLRRFRRLYGDKRIDCLFTDSYNDRAIMDISERVYFVRKGRIKRLKKAGETE